MKSRSRITKGNNVKTIITYYKMYGVVTGFSVILPLCDYGPWNLVVDCNIDVSLCLWRVVIQGPESRIGITLILIKVIEIMYGVITSFSVIPLCVSGHRSNSCCHCLLFIRLLVRFFSAVTVNQTDMSIVYIYNF